MQNSKLKHREIVVLAASLALSIINCPLAIFAQSGGTYTITQSVVASGGATGSAGGAYKVDGTAGQAAAGTNVSGSSYAVSGGFWQYGLAPSSAGVSVSGRVTTESGRGIRNAVLTLSGTDGVRRVARTGSFGYYRFEDVPAGETYILSIATKRFTFSNPTRVISAADDVTDADFTALNE